MRTVVLPIEIHKREAYPKAILAAYLSSRGNRVILLPDFLVPHLSVEHAVYLGKNDIQYSRFKKNVLSGSKFLYLDDEGAPIIGNADLRLSLTKKRLWRGIEDEADAILTWGEFQRTCFSDIVKKPIIAVGYPGIHVCKSAFRGRLNSYHKLVHNSDQGYILVNTRFPTINSRFPLARVRNDNPYFHVEGAHISEFRQVLMNEVAGFEQYLLLIESLAKAFPSKKIVVRPHPAEEAETYRYLLSDMPEVLVDGSNHVAPWLDGADYVVMNGCTTSIQAYLMGVNVINYVPDGNGHTSSYVDGIGVSCSSADEVIRLVDKLYTDNCNNSNSDWTDKDDLYSLHLDTFKLITDIIEEYYPKTLASSRSASGGGAIRLGFIASAWVYFKTMYKKDYSFYSDKLDLLIDRIPYLLDVDVRTERFRWGCIFMPT